mmetsp:Transcript_5688/g.11971  ORF Transcript_5688/g.11971 Transcript_5688/m.11971 type:complete len:115 (+) Transcript_5688:108-452(+)
MFFSEEVRRMRHGTISGNGLCGGSKLKHTRRCLHGEGILDPESSHFKKYRTIVFPTTSGDIHAKHVRSFQHDGLVDSDLSVDAAFGLIFKSIFRPSPGVLDAIRSTMTELELVP